MKVKRFFAPDMRQAMRRVREEIGANAVIVSNHRVAGGVEVVAAEEHEYDAAQAEFQREQTRQRQQEERMRAAVSSRQALSPDQLREELLRAKSRIAVAQQSGSTDMAASQQGNRQMRGGDDEQLRAILESLKARQKAKANEAAQNFERNRQTQRLHDPLAVEPQLDEPEHWVSAPVRGRHSQSPLADPATPQPSVSQSAAPQPAPPQQAAPQPAAPAPVAPAAADDAVIRAMQDEIQQLKAMLVQQAQEAQQARSASVPAEPPAPDLVEPSAAPDSMRDAGPLARKLGLIGISERLSRQLLAGVEPNIAADKAWRNTLARLAESIPVIGEDFIERGGMIAFVGPTGVGKTTTIGKLAAQYVLKYGSASLALVTTDSYRIAAHEQLRTFGRILDVPVRVVNEKETLDEVLQSLRNKRLVLVDTAGLNASEPHSELQMEMLDSVSVRLKKLLVLSCSSQRQVMESAYAAYKEMGLNGCVLSKLDESGSLGEALSLAVEQRLPIAYLADGQKIPDDVSVARKHELVSRAVVTAQKSRATEAKIAQSAKVTPLFKAG
ncbi:flagellar biosynthesis protein FlhF [Marinobacterium arenosum]|uniref:flagellar biosynthesis protein FlhF n=1 Tax=Marinobacterium arenosum TaxID=2862496 RepID=UPI001C983895|nr:flagellar biosynthesis protein FlhF [Marinobacterium arenosum]MBY4675960.1 flagellar biosynthesis protein FlhF [Marinobacterium arenosum]